jgi:hypothetical protein
MGGDVGGFFVILEGGGGCIRVEKISTVDPSDESFVAFLLTSAFTVGTKGAPYLRPYLLCSSMFYVHIYVTMDFVIRHFKLKF